MSAWKDHWPLARRWAFVKSRLLRLPQVSHGIEVDFCPLPDIVNDEYGFWLGLAVDHGLDLILATSILDEPPIVQDLLEILSDAMERSYPRAACRPERVFLRDNPEWERLLPHLCQVGIETVATEDLLYWDAKAEELIKWLKDRWSTPSNVVIQTDEEPTVAETLLELRILGHEFLFLRQLEDGSWLTMPALPEHVFAYGDDLWPKLARQIFGERTISALKIKRRPDDPSIN